MQALADSAVIVRCRIKTDALEQGAVYRAFLGAIKEAFERESIEIPYPQLMLHEKQKTQYIQ